MKKLLTLLCAFCFCGGLVQTALADEQPVKATIAEIVAKPETFNKKLVVFDAKLVEICVDDGCLVLKDKLDLIEGIPPATGSLPTVKTGQTLRVTGTVQARRKTGAEAEAKVNIKSIEQVKK